MKTNKHRLFLLLLIVLFVTGCSKDDTDSNNTESASNKEETASQTEIPVLDYAVTDKISHLKGIGTFSEGLCFIVHRADGEDHAMCINEKGETIFDIYAPYLPTPFYHGFSIVSNSEGNVQIINTKGDMLLPTAEPFYYDASKIAIDEETDIVYADTAEGFYIIENDEAHIASQEELQLFDQKESSLKYWVGSPSGDSFDVDPDDWETAYNNVKQTQQLSEDDHWTSWSVCAATPPYSVPTIYQDLAALSRFYSDSTRQIVYKTDPEEAFLIDEQGNLLGARNTFYFSLDDLGNGDLELGHVNLSQTFHDNLMAVRMSSNSNSDQDDSTDQSYGYSGTSTSSDQLYGYIDMEGEVVLPGVYTYVTDFNDEVAWVKEVDDNSYYCINKAGEKLGKLTYSAVLPQPFHNGYALSLCIDDDTDEITIYVIEQPKTNK